MWMVAEETTIRATNYIIMGKRINRHAQDTTENCYKRVLYQFNTKAFHHQRKPSKTNNGQQHRSYHAGPEAKAM